MNETNNTTHRISQRDNDILMGYLQTKFDSYGSNMAPYMREKYHNEYVLKYARTMYGYGKNAVPKKLTYDNLGEFLAITGISYKEMFHVMDPDTELGWHDEYEERMNRALEEMTPEQVEEMTRLFDHMVPMEYKKIWEFSELRCYNIATAITYVKSKEWGIQFFTGMGLRSNWVQARIRTCPVNVIPIYLLPVISMKTGLPIHWLMQLSDEDHVICANGKIEAAMDRYCMLAANIKKSLIDGLEAAKAGAGK